MRWGKRAFVGGVVDWVGLPHGQKIKVLVGKNEQNGGFDRRPNGAWGGQYSIPVGRSRAWVFSAQSMQQRSYQDSLLRKPFGSGAATGKLAAVSGRWTASAEAGYGYYFSEDNGQSGGLVAQLRAAAATDRDLLNQTTSLMATLRSTHGCPWDRKQTHQSLRPFLLEETYEALDALDAGDYEALPGELGDVLFQVVFHAQIAAEEKRWDMADSLTDCLAPGAS
jgi:NTP pyrophosphatase (non-canonical NTP hydrolase)